MSSGCTNSPVVSGEDMGYTCSTRGGGVLDECTFRRRGARVKHSGAVCVSHCVGGACVRAEFMKAKETMSATSEETGFQATQDVQVVNAIVRHRTWSGVHSAAVHQDTDELLLIDRAVAGDE